ncbi:MAG: cytochrome c oxidase subunit 2 [Candidatus Heimdallarchaeota archaeon LC_2]|nr:MAG: cytochrome c oxidase subunit 2 [Candidatus Heimdallarchaeota archaeon LC_2]
MSLTPPSKRWHIIPIGKDEKIWLFLMLMMILMMGTLTVGWVFLGDQNPPEVYTHYDNVDDLRADFIAQNTALSYTAITLNNGKPGFAVPADGDVYMFAERWQWNAETDTEQVHGLQFKVGERYRLHLGSVDVLHGFQLIGGDFIVSLQIVPEYDYVLDFTPDDTGTFQIICNEYCGLGHQDMAGYLEVVA